MEADDPREPRRLTTLWPIVVGSAVFSVIVWLAVFKQAMLTPFNHDEHQFVAAGRLLAEGWLPYRDFPSNHMPYLALVYAAVFKATGWNLLPARAVSAVSAALAAGIVFALTSSFFRGQSARTRVVIASAACLALITNPIFRYTSGRAWNHDFATLLTLAATVALLGSKPGARAWKWVLASGALVGLAIGTRLTYVLALIPFILAIVSDRPKDGWPGLRSDIGAFGAGLALASLPWIALFATAPRRFIFGNITYQLLNTEYRELLGHRVGETLRGKAVYFYHVLLDKPANLVLFLAFGVVVAWIAVRWLKRDAGLSREIILLGGLSLVLLGSAFVPTPSWYQYFYAPVPFVVLTVAFAVSVVPAMTRVRQAISWMGMFVLLAGGIALVSQGDWPSLRDARSWVPVQAHELGEQIGDIVGEGKVLTLSPIFPLEGGLGIYKPLATGPFSWRVGPLLTQEKRLDLDLFTYTDLETALDGDPPAAILTGFEAGNAGFEPRSIGGLEVPLRDFAEDHGYTLVTLTTPLMSHEVRLWHR